MEAQVVGLQFRMVKMEAQVVGLQFWMVKMEAWRAFILVGETGSLEGLLF